MFNKAFLYFFRESEEPFKMSLWTTVIVLVAVLCLTVLESAECNDTTGEWLYLAFTTVSNPMSRQGSGSLQSMHVGHKLIAIHISQVDFFIVHFPKDRAFGPVYVRAQAKFKFIRGQCRTIRGRHFFSLSGGGAQSYFLNA